LDPLPDNLAVVAGDDTGGVAIRASGHEARV
jgi:hypothetical protein